MQWMTWTRDANHGGHTGVVVGQFKAYVLNNGTWTLYRWGDYKHSATGSATGVISAKAAVIKAALKL